MSESNEEQQASIPTTPGDDQADVGFRRKLENEAYLTAGCGKGKEKIRTVDAFWSTVWPGLERLGWTKVRTHVDLLPGEFLRLLLSS